MKHLDGAMSESLMTALEEMRYDDCVLMFAQILRQRQEVISPHARASLPVDATICQPLLSNHLTPQEIEAFDIRNNGWHMIAVERCCLIDARAFPYTVNDPSYRSHIETYVRGFDSPMDEEPTLYGAFHQDGRLRDYQTAFEFRPECRSP